MKKKYTRFEVARILGARSLQLAMGAPPLIDPSTLPVKDPIALAIAELLNNVLPMTVKRPTYGGKYELIPVSRLLSEENKRYLRTTLESWTLSELH